MGDRPEAERPEEVRWRRAEGGTWVSAKTKTAPFPDPKLWRLKQISWNQIQNKKATFPHPTKVKESAWLTLKVSWSNLEPGTDYVFTIGNSPEMKFRTAPAKLKGPLVFVEGGDVDVTETAEKMIALGCAQDPLFFSLGGDLAYSEGVDVKKEISFWKQWARAAKTKDGRVVPFVAGIGNHEVKGGYWQEGATFEQMRERAPFFYALFGGLYRTDDPVALDFGDYLSLLLMDTGHIAPMDRQTGWLGKNLEDRHKVPWVFLSWHVASYPSARKWDTQPMSGYARDHWIPVIEKSHAAGVFNHHDHDLQRVETEGRGGRKIMVFGNGALGIETRDAVCEESKKLAKAGAKENYVNVVTLTPDKATVRSLGREGQELDRTEIRSSSLR